MLNNVFKKKYIPLTSGTAAGCRMCERIVLEEVPFSPAKVCPECNHHFTMHAGERIELLADQDSFRELDHNLTSFNILDFPDYDDKLITAAANSGLNEAIVCGKATIGGYPLIMAVMDSSFMMGSMGSVVGEKICRAAEKAMELKCPLLIFAASGGARMQEGTIALMQMAKTSAAIKRFHQAGLFFICVFTNPVTGGVLASFASLADIIIAEPGAMAGFTGPRVIAQTLQKKLPPGFQCAEFLLEHGQVDLIVDRTELKSTLERLLKLHLGGKNGKKTI